MQLTPKRLSHIGSSKKQGIIPEDALRVLLAAL
jgi:hypothetical protein